MFLRSVALRVGMIVPENKIWSHACTQSHGHSTTQSHRGGGETHISPDYQLAFTVPSELLLWIDDDVMTNAHLQFALFGHGVGEREAHVQVPMAQHH